MLNTLVSIVNEYMGSQAVLFVPSVVKGPLRTLVDSQIMYKGVSENPS